MKKKSEKNIYYSIIDTNQKKERKKKSKVKHHKWISPKKKKGVINEYIGICSLHVSLHKILGVNRGQKISRYASRSN